MASNRGIAYLEPGKTEVQDIPYPEFELKDGPGVNPDNVGRQVPHGAILKVVTTNICGSDQHMVSRPGVSGDLFVCLTLSGRGGSCERSGSAPRRPG